MPPFLCNDGESSSSESSFVTLEEKQLTQKPVIMSSSNSKRVHFDDCRNRFNWIESIVDFRYDLWYNRDDYHDIMEDNWDIVDFHAEGNFRESSDDTYRGLEPLSHSKPCYMSAVFAVIQEQERLCRNGAYCEDKIAHTSQVMSREDQRVALKLAEHDYVAVYGKQPKLMRKQSKSLESSSPDDKSMASTVSSSSSSRSSLGVAVPLQTKSRKVYVSPIRRIQRLLLLSPKKKNKMLLVKEGMPLGIPAL